MIGGILRARSVRSREGDWRAAVIDIGSNTVRLVIYGGDRRAPETLWNEKVAARLGSELADTGRIAKASADAAVAALARFQSLVRDWGIEQVETVATAAARDAENGPEFLARVGNLGLSVSLLTGEEEAVASAYGALGAFPQAEGLVADIGGGSLELVPIGNGSVGTGASLPLGTLRLPALRSKNDFPRKVAKAIAKAGIDANGHGSLYMIGGTWRALAVLAMRDADHPLTDPHGLVLTRAEAAAITRKAIRNTPSQLAQVRGISGMRAEKLPDAAVLLRVLLDELGPRELVFSSWGLREGLLFRSLADADRARDPLLAGARAFAARADAPMPVAGPVADWVSAAHALQEGDERLLETAAVLASALHRVEPNLRQAQALEWALDKRWIGIDFRGRALLAAALLASMGDTSSHTRLGTLAGVPDIARFVGIGLTIRLAQRLGAMSFPVLGRSQLARDATYLTLTLAVDDEALGTGPVLRDLANLARWLALEPVLATGDAPSTQLAVAGAASGKKGIRTSSGSPSDRAKV